MKPWKYTVSKNGRHQISEVGGGNVCMIWNCKDKEHNANLIAAAPDMYEEIKSEIDWLRGYIEWLAIGSPQHAEATARLSRKEELLAKARGEL